jgi:DNA polymerase-4
VSPPVLYVDIPGFYAEVERARDPALSGRPVLVGGDPRKRGVVQSASLEAVSAGVEPGMLVTEALARCPRARLLRTNMRRYREAASQLRACLRRVEERLEPAGLGAAFLGPARSELGRRTAERLQQAVATELGLPLRVGIAPVRFLARLAAESAPAGGVVEVGPDDVSGFLHPLPVGRLPGVGPRTAARLDALGARTVGQVRALGRAVLEEALGNHGLAILEAAEGRGETRVRAAPHARSLSQESTLADPELDRPVLEERLRELAAAVGDTLRREGLAARRVAVKVRYADQETTTRSRTLGQAVEAPAEIEAVALDLLARTQAGARAVRLVGLSLSSLAPSRRDDRQLELFPQA